MELVNGSVSLDDAIAWLAQQRRTSEKAPYRVVQYGEWIVMNHKLGVLGDDVWAFLEQLAIAAAELGKQDLADVCVQRLDSRFPNSKRVTILQGMLLEAKGMAKEALMLYEACLKDDQSHILLNKRRIAAMRAIPGREADATQELARFVDVFPMDTEAWLELASLYTEQHKYAQAAYALEELVLLAPQNSYFLLQYAETLYTAGDIATAYKMYLRILELARGDIRVKENSSGERAAGPWVRTLWGLKMCATQLLQTPSKAKSSDGQVSADCVREVDALATRLLLESVYAADAAQRASAAERAAARTALAPSSS